MLPAQSEAVLASMHVMQMHSAWLLVVVATIGNVLGALVNWYLGGCALHFKDRKWFPVSEQGLAKATRYYQKFGVWSLLFAWLPFIGDAITVAAGVLRAPIAIFLVLVTLGKALRYVAVVGLFSV